MNHRPAKFVHDALREGQRLRPKTWGKKSRCPPSPDCAELETLRAENARLRSALLRIEREVVDARWACTKPEEIPQVNTDWVLGVTDEALRQRLECELYKGEG